MPGAIVSLLRFPLIGLAGIAGVVLTFSGCETTPAEAGKVSASATGTPSLAEGRRLYYGRCTSCHAPEPVDGYTRAEWRSEVAHMRKRAKLTPAEEADLLAFLMANALDA
ncbi:MAG: hypothetical protein KDN19_15705 [Verrucomicrobiae bacterium]|nr:hypothetical protein [Verrucomicrobiae bacterium]